MKKIKTLLFIIAVAAISSSCSVTTPLSASAVPVGNKVGKSSTGILFGFIRLNKSYSIAEAAHNGKITGGISFVDLKTSWIPVIRGVYYKKEIIVQGN